MRFHRLLAGAWAVLDRLVIGAALLVGIAFLLLSLLITWSVIARKYGGWIPPGVEEIGGFVVAVGSTWVLAWGLKSKGHIRIDIFYRRFPAPVQGALNVIALTMIAAFAAFIAWRAWNTAAVSFERSARTASELSTLLALPQTLWAAGFSLFAVYAVVLWMTAAIDLFRGKAREVARRHGPEIDDPAALPGG